VGREPAGFPQELISSTTYVSNPGSGSGAGGNAIIAEYDGITVAVYKIPR
jgi:hypothetical protein